VGLCAEEAGDQAGDRQIDVQRLPMQAITLAEDFNLFELLDRRVLKALGQLRREGEGATVRQLDDDALKLSIISR
jgi:hypothetical protein